MMSQVTLDQAMQIAMEHHHAGRLQQAEQIYRQILEHSPDHAPAHHNLAVALTEVGQLDEAIAACRRAVDIAPGSPEIHCALGNALAANGQSDEAIAAYRQAISLRPNYAQAHCNLGNLLGGKGQFDEALAAHRRAVTADPQMPEAHYNLGNILRKVGRLDEAVSSYRQAISLRPGYAKAHNNLGLTLEDKGCQDDAIAAYRQAISLNPNWPELYLNLGNALKNQGLVDEVMAAYHQALALRPDYAEAYCNVGNVLKDAGELDRALASYRHAMSLAPESSEFHSNAVYTVCFHPDFNSQQILREAENWAHRHADALAAEIRPHDNDPAPDRRIRIGYVSPYFSGHVVGRNVLPILENHDRKRFQVHCFSSVKAADAMTAQFRQIADRWYDAVTMSDRDLADLVRRERIDILVDLNLHMAGSRLLTFARKPAPVQVTWSGYPGTTGLSAIDYRLTDPFLDPPRLGDEFYTEKSIRLPNSFWCYRPTADTPDVNPLPALSNGFLTFGCLNNFCKVTGPALGLWAQVLQSVARSRMIIRCPIGSPRRQVLRRFEERGINPDRIDFVNLLHLPEYLRRYQQMDIAFDPIPYTGHSTSLDAFWMGVPVVTLAGETVASRGGVSIASNLGLVELIAKTGRGYVEIAAGLSGDMAGLAKLRATLRERMRRSPLMDERRFTLDIERAYQEMWRTWCEKKGER
jgi:protein O-GlcNAc transferase